MCQNKPEADRQGAASGLRRSSHSVGLAVAESWTPADTDHADNTPRRNGTALITVRCTHIHIGDGGATPIEIGTSDR
jgi:hypothetical protein